MSYCRIGPDSDIYVIRTLAGHWECVSCTVVQPLGLHSATIFTLKALKRHVAHHKAMGHKVPDYAVQRIDKELAEEEQEWVDVPYFGRIHAPDNAG